MSTHGVKCARCGREGATNGILQAIVPGFSATNARLCPDCSLSLSIWSKSAVAVTNER